MNSFMRWVAIAGGYTRSFRVEDKKLAQHIKLNAMVMTIKVVTMEQHEDGYWYVKLLSVGLPSPEQTRKLTKEKLY